MNNKFQRLMNKQVAMLNIVCLCLFLACDNPTHTSARLPVQPNADTAIDRDNLPVFNTLDKRQIIDRLFDHPQWDSNGLAAWKPNYYELESLYIPLSYDNRFHTSLDTILYFTDSQKQPCAAAIFSTYYLHIADSGRIEPSGCHFCGVPIGVALFTTNKAHQWRLYDFQKELTTLGYFGRYKTGGSDSGYIQLKVIGNGHTALSITEGPGGNGGFVEGYEQVYSLEDWSASGSIYPPLKLLLSNNYDCREEQLTGPVRPHLTILKQGQRLYDIEATTFRNATLVIKTYRFNPEARMYLSK